jgi:hypothetical protein
MGLRSSASLHFVTPAWPRLADRLVRKTAVFVSPVRIRLDNAGNVSIAPLRVEGPCETDIATPFHRRVPRTPRGRYCVWAAVWAAVQILEGTRRLNCQRKLWSWREELNLQPAVYKTAALPLSYASLDVMACKPILRGGLLLSQSCKPVPFRHA